MSIEPFDRQLQQLRGLSARLAQQIAALPRSDQAALADTAAAIENTLGQLDPQNAQLLHRFELIDYQTFQAAIVAGDPPQEQTNITEQDAEIELHSGLRFAQRIIGAISDVIYIYDLVERQIIWVSQGIVQVLGYTPPEIAALGANLLATVLHPDDVEALLAHHRQLLRLREGEHLAHEYRVKDATGEWRWMYSQDMIFQRMPNGEPRSICGVAQDITARKQVGEALQRQTERLNMLHAIDQAILAAQSPATIAQDVVNQIDRLIPGGHVSLLLFDTDRQDAQVLAAAGHSMADLPVGMRLPLAPILKIAAIQPGQSAHIADLAAMAAQLPSLRPLLDAGLHTVIIAPLVYQGEQMGLLNLFATSHAAVAHYSGDFLGQVASQLAVAIQHAQLFELVRAGRQRLQSLSHRLLKVQETERRHIAHELHDEIGQALTALKINLQAIQRTEQDATPARHLEESISIVAQTIEQVRNLALDLRPALLDELGLVPALRWYLDRQRQRSGLQIDFVAEPPELRLPADLATVCFRVVQEALTNIIRHAYASAVTVELRQRAADLLLVVQDDGAGFDVAAALERAAGGASLGLLGLQERVLLVGGQVTIDSAPAAGTTITALLPTTPNTPLERRRRGGVR
jgi:PAS domain S-box-containing protein